MKQYQAYLFDWDGTLAQTLEVWLSIERDLYRKYGLSLTDSEIARSFGDWSAAEKFGLKGESLMAFNRELPKIAHEAISKTPLYPHVSKVLNGIKDRGAKLALITSSVRETIDVVLAHNELVELFDLVVTADEVSEHKPHPEGILYVLESLGMAKDKAVMIGDSDKDLGAAQNAGVDSILFFPDSHRTFHDEKHLRKHNPTFVIDDLQKILQ